MTCLTMLQHFYVHVINTWKFIKHQAIDYLHNLLEYNSLQDAYLKFQNGGSRAHS